jgi:hypothetical protein
MRKHGVHPYDDVNPIYTKSVEQIHMVCGTLVARPRQRRRARKMAVPPNHDLLQG